MSSRILAETLHSAEALSEATGLLFEEFVYIGSPEGPKRQMPRLRNIPNKQRGVYIIVACLNSVLYPVYGGKSWAKKEGIRHRLRCEFLVGQNEGGKSLKPQGPTHVHLTCTELGATPVYYAALAPMNDRSNEEIDAAELVLLSKLDFVANVQKNGRQRLHALRSLVPAEPVQAEKVVYETVADDDNDTVLDDEADAGADDGCSVDDMGNIRDLIDYDYSESESEADPTESKRRVKPIWVIEEDEEVPPETKADLLSETLKEPLAPSRKDVYSHLADADALIKSIDARLSARMPSN